MKFNWWLLRSFQEIQHKFKQSHGRKHLKQRHRRKKTHTHTSYTLIGWANAMGWENGMCLKVVGHIGFAISFPNLVQTKKNRVNQHPTANSSIYSLRIRWYVPSEKDFPTSILFFGGCDFGTINPTRSGRVWILRVYKQQLRVYLQLLLGFLEMLR